MSGFRRVLVANRGEIAVRILRACRWRGLTGIAVYSAADAGAPHVGIADLAVALGPAPARDSYLSVGALLRAAAETGAEALHPGYGFLAENAEFAESVQAAGLVWIGPPPEAIRTMGEKTAARRAMEAAGVPVVPGVVRSLAGIDAARAEAAAAGYPVLLKAAGGGGGRGMRIVEREEDLPRAFEAATREAEKAFSNPEIYLERYLPEARHIEIQIVADRHVNVVHLGERECSLQRRHQKILEEAPAPGLTAGQRSAMGAVAVRAAQAVGYVGAGTIEFLVTPDGAFYFLEMNTRIQVEHPVTEMVTGVDLVALQLTVAAGERLPFGQDEVTLEGHSIECRIIAEDPGTGFLPATGVVHRYREPNGFGIRFDSGIEAGVEVSTHYDSLLAKLITWGETREEALARARSALDETAIGGVMTNRAFQRALLDDPRVVAGRVHTATLETHIDEILDRMAAAKEADEPLAAALAALGVHGATMTTPDRYSIRATDGRRSSHGSWRASARWTGHR